MGFLSKMFRRRSKFSPLFTELGPELSARYGTSSGNHKEQIDKTMHDLKIDPLLATYAYVLYLRDEDYKRIADSSPEEWQTKEDELNEHIKQYPFLSNSRFYESHLGLDHT